MATVTTVYTSTDVPKVLGDMSTTSSQLIITDSHVLTNLTCDVNITAPDEGPGGPDPSLLTVYLYRHSPTIGIILQNAVSDPLTGVNFDIDRAAYDDLNSFNEYDTLGTWSLQVYNFSGGSWIPGTINSWGIRASYDVPAVPAFFPSAPTAVTIPTNIKYGQGGLVKRNIKYKYDLIDESSNLLVQVKRVPFDCYVENISVSAYNAGTGTNTTLSLKKFSNGITTTLVSSNILMESGQAYSNRKFFGSNKLGVNKGDILYFTVDSVGTSVTNLTAYVTLNNRN